MNLKSILVGAAATSCLALSVVSTPAQAAPVATVAPTVQTKISHDLNVKNVDQVRGHDYNRTCDGSPHGTLYEGESSEAKFGWEDTDAVYIAKGRSLKWDKAGPNVVIWSCNDVRATGYYKVSPSITLNGQTRKFYYKNC
jgi:hypothetical protein